MLYPCPICRHLHHTEIDAALDNRENAEALATRFRVFRIHLVQHHNVCRPSGLPPLNPIEQIPAGPDRVYANLKRVHTATGHILRRALAAGRLDAALKATAQDARNAATEAKLLPTLREATQLPPYHSITRAEFARLRGVIVNALTPYPEARQAVADAVGASEEARKLQGPPPDGPE